MSVIDLERTKKIKKVTKILEELKAAEKQLSVSLSLLTPYKKYTPIRDAINNLLESKMMVVLYLKKCEDALEKYNAGKLEKTSQKDTTPG